MMDDGETEKNHVVLGRPDGDGRAPSIVNSIGIRSHRSLDSEPAVAAAAALAYKT